MPPFDWERFYSDPQWTPEALAFEMQLGVHYFNDPATLHEVRQAVTQLRDVLTTLATMDVHDSFARLSIARDVEMAFFRADKDARESAGQVGFDVRLDELLEHGNVRELTTAFYNAAYFNRASPHTLAKALLDVIDNGRWEAARAAGVDVKELAHAREHLDESLLRAVGSRVEDVVKPKEPRFFRDVFATFHVISRSEHPYRDQLSVVMSQKGRDTRGETEQIALATTLAHYEELGAPLGRFERAFIESFQGPLEPHSKLPWREGYILHDTGGGVWARRVGDDGYPVLDGISATTTRLLTAAKLIGIHGARSEGFLHALTGWMLPARDHSLFELLRGASIAGVEPVPFRAPGSRPTAIDLYRNLPGIDLHTIRTEIARDGMLPHEARYSELARDPDGFSETQHKVPQIADRISPQLKSGHVTDADLHTWLERNGIDPHDPEAVRAFSENLTESHIMALSVYTRHSHYLINNVITAQMVSFGKSETLVRNIHDGKVNELVDNYLGKLATNDKALPLPLALRPILHEGPGHLDSTSALRPDARQWIEATQARNEALAQARIHTAAGDKAGVREAVSQAKEAEKLADAARQRIGAEIKQVTPKLFNEVRWHADMVYDALKQLPTLGTPEKPVIAYRGDWTTPVWSPIYGSPMLPSGRALSVLSVSQLPEVAVRFMSENPASDNRVIAVYQLTGVNARDISVFSSFAADQEAVLPPGSRTRQVSNPLLEQQTRELLPPEWRDRVKIIVLEEAE